VIGKQGPDTDDGGEYRRSALPTGWPPDLGRSGWTAGTDLLALLLPVGDEGVRSLSNPADRRPRGRRQSAGQ